MDDDLEVNASKPNFSPVSLQDDSDFDEKEKSSGRKKAKKAKEDMSDLEREDLGESDKTYFDMDSTRHSSHIFYGEEYAGENENYIPPSDLDLNVKEFRDSLQEKDEIHEIEEIESQEPDETSEGSETEEGEQDLEELEVIPSVTPTKSGGLDQLPLSSMFEALYLQPKEKTISEIKFEAEHREIIEEEMKKFIQRTMVKETVVVHRKTLEKTKMALTDLDISGLYPPPKVIESEPSFAFDEEDEVDKGITKAQETDADIVKYVMDFLRETSKTDPDSLFIHAERISIVNNVRRAVEDIVRAIKTGEIPSIPKAVNESLSELKPKLRSAAIRILTEKLGKYERVSVEEGEGHRRKKSIKKEFAQAVVETPSVIAKTGLSKGEKPQKYHGIKEKKLRKAEAEEKREFSEEKESEIIKPMDKSKEAVKEMKFPKQDIYEKIDWELFLTASEKKISTDSEFMREMEKYIQSRKKELELVRKEDVERAVWEKRYRSTDRTIMLENANLNVTMKFILNSGEIFTCAYRYFMTFKEIKEDLSGIFRVPPDVLIIYRDDEEMKDGESAHDLEPKIEPFESVTFRLLTLDNDKWRLRSSHLELPVPDIITCTVETGQDHNGIPECKEVVVEIEQRKIKKPFVGGYRDICTGIEYHHAFSQSAPRLPTLPVDRRATTDTQTSEFRSKKVDTNCDRATQMSRSDYYVAIDGDKIMSPHPYVDYETYLQQKDMDSKIILIQRYVRAMIIRKFVKKMSEEYRARKIFEEEEQRKRDVEREIRIKQDITKMVYPKKKADFDMLYAMVERWRKSQIERIGKLKTEAPKKAELCAVLEKEIKLLEAIEVHRIAVAKENKRRKELRFLEKVSKPETWTGYRGTTVTMDTLKTQRARELRELYLALSRDDLNYQDRIELLISLKYALRVNCSRLTDELTTLLNQECELLIRGVNSKKLEYLRRRIDHLFLKHFKEPDFNPQVAKFDPEYNREPLKQNVLFCKMCHQMKIFKEFEIKARDSNCNACRSCMMTYNIAVPRIDLNPYRHILKCVRKDEQKRNCYSSCAFILQDEDMRFLVERIWHNKSAISENDNLIDLRMPRWDKDKDWTPWNCMLLTETEAKAHLRIDPYSNYEKQLIGEVVSKHQLAKRHFRQMLLAENRMRDSGKWANVVDMKNYSRVPLCADRWDLTGKESATI